MLERHSQRCTSPSSSLRSTSSAPALRAQTRPAMEFGSGEEGLRPASSGFLSPLRIPVVEYVDIDALSYFKAPGPYCGAEGRWRNVALTGSASV